MANDKSQILVSIVCITYNHEPYLRKALDGFLMQETTFPVEIILAEDCSTDGTRAICEEYAARYPEKIHYIWSETNVGAVANERRAMKAARGKYIAFCEGDDYWTAPQKLQKQVDFMEAHPEYSVTFHRYRIYNEQKNEWSDDNIGRFLQSDTIDGIDVSLEQSLDIWVTQYLTAVIRSECYDYAWADIYSGYCDTHMFYHLMLQGKAYVFAFEGGVYRQTGKGTYSNQDSYLQQKRCIEMYAEMNAKNKDERLKAPYTKALQYFIDTFSVARVYRSETIKASFDLYRCNLRFMKFLKNIVKIYT